MTDFDVGIVGAGIHGASVAYHLGRAGARTVILERDTPASGPTGRSSAICRALYTNRFLARTAHESIDMLERLAEHTGGGDAGFERTGMLHLHHADDQALVERLVTELLETGIDVAMVNPADYADMDGENTLALWEAGAGYADPAGTTNALVADAVRHGVEARERTAVTRIEERPGGGAVLTSADGTRVACERVLLAAGPWTKSLALQVGADLPLTVERHTVALFAWAHATPMPFAVADVPGGYYLKPEGAEQYGLGTLHSEPEVNPDAFQEEVGVDEALTLAEHAVGRFGALAQSSFVGGWASLYDVSPDWQPVIGEIADGIFVTAGSSGHGFKLAPALARHVAGLVVDGGYDRELDQFSPRRFEVGRPLPAGFGDARILG